MTSPEPLRDGATQRVSAFLKAADDDIEPEAVEGMVREAMRRQATRPRGRPDVAIAAAALVVVVISMVAQSIRIFPHTPIGASAPIPVAATTTTSPTSDKTGFGRSPQSPSGNSMDASVSTYAPESSGLVGLSGSIRGLRTLTLADVFDHDGWEEGLVYVPKRSNAIQAMHSRVLCGQKSELELRFADQNGSLRADVAQALHSKFSNSTLEFRLLVDGRLIDTALVKFNQMEHLETSLTGVNSVRLEVRQTNGGNPCDAIAVITDLSVVPGTE